LQAHHVLGCPGRWSLPGAGPLEGELRSRFSRSVRFVGHVSRPTIFPTRPLAHVRGPLKAALARCPWERTRMRRRTN
jgi:hypothetical protein